MIWEVWAILGVIAVLALGGLAINIHEKRVEEAKKKAAQSWIDAHTILDRRLTEAEAENTRLKAELEELKNNV